MNDPYICRFRAGTETEKGELTMIRVLYNPHAGQGWTAEKEAEIRAFYPSEECVFYDMTTVSYPAFFANTLAKDERLMIVGGDGTLNRFINETAGIQIQNEITYWHGGSGNDFMHDVAADADHPIVINPYLQNLPTVEVNGKTYRFLNGVGYGIDGYCCEVGDKQKATSDKPVNYTGIAIKGLLFHFKPADATVTVDGVTKSYEKVWLAPTMHGRFYGGGMIATPGQTRNNPDGTLSLLVWHGSGKLPTLMNFPNIFKGEHTKKSKMCEVLTGKDITVRFSHPTALQIDGETILNVTEYHARSYRLAPEPASV